jgi:hypothetical protein
MAEYQYHCQGCRHFFTTLSRDSIPPCPVCGTVATRHFSFGIVRSVPEHFNYSVGSYVSNERQLRDAIKVISEEQTYRTGVEHDYEYLSRADLADATAHGVTEEGLDDTYRTQHDNGDNG